MEAIGFRQIRRQSRLAMTVPPDPDPDPSFSADKRLWVGLTICLTAFVLLAITVQRFLPAHSGGPSAGQVEIQNSTPLMTQPQLLENQQAMPELAGFDSQNPPPNLSDGNGPIQRPGPSSPLLQGGLG